MEDDEEYSYKSYAKQSDENIAKFRDDDEELSYSAVSGGSVDIAAYRESNDEEFAYSEFAELAEELEEIRTESYGDYLIEEFSAETNVSRVTQFTKLPENAVIYAFAIIYFVVGVLCVAITQRIIDVLPYIVGGMMIVIGFTRFIIALKNREYRHLKTNHTATSLIVTALGIMIIIQHFQPENDSAITFISIVWGILGLFEGAHAFNHAFKRIANSERCVYFLIKGLIEVVVAFLLLYDPGNHEAHYLHIIVFGLNLIFDAVTMLPKVKGYLSDR